MKKSFEDPADLDGFEDLNDEDQEKVKKAYEDGHVAPEDVPESARKPEADEDDEEKPKKKRAPRKKKDDGDDEEEPKPKKARAPRKKKAEVDEDGDEEEKPKRKRAPPKKKAKVCCFPCSCRQTRLIIVSG